MIVLKSGGLLLSPPTPMQEKRKEHAPVRNLKNVGLFSTTMGSLKRWANFHLDF
jgi:hypothetical protein